MGGPGRGVLAVSSSSLPAVTCGNLGRIAMAVDTFMAYVGVYDTVGDADADYQLVKDLHTKANLIDAYDAAVIERRADGNVKITRKHETPTRAGGVLGAGVGLATGLVV